MTRTSGLLLLLAACAVGHMSAQNLKSYAQVQGFEGRVRTVRTKVVTQNRELLTEEATSVLIATGGGGIQEFDSFGEQTKSGYDDSGKFEGLYATRQRDEHGRVVQVSVYDTNGKLISGTQFEYGPFGETSHKLYNYGKLVYRTDFRYDAQGHQVEVLSFEGGTQLVSRLVTTYDASGHKVSFEVNAPSGIVKYTYDPTSENMRSFEIVDESGVLIEYVTMDDDKVLSFYMRDPGSSKKETSFRFGDSLGDRVYQERTFLIDGGYTRAWRSYGDRDNRFPKKFVFFDEDGRRKAEANYAYEFDSHGNWTHRLVSLWTAESNQTRLYEEDTRTLTYFDER